MALLHFYLNCRIVLNFNKSTSSKQLFLFTFLLTFSLRWGDGWLDNVGFYPPKEAANFTGTYILPDSSPSQPSGQYLYYFIGIENINQDDVTILQPVLAWEDGGWTFTSWVTNLSFFANLKELLPFRPSSQFRSYYWNS